MKPKRGERTHAGVGIKNVVGLWLRVGVCVAVLGVQRSRFGISCVADTEKPLTPSDTYGGSLSP